MKSKFAQIIFSTRLMAVLFVAFAIAMATGTFLDAGAETSPTPYSRTLVYNTWWFEGIMILFVINFFGNIFKYRLIQQKKWATLLMHLSFVLILVGAGVSRYTGFEGMLPISEGESNNKILSERVYLKTFVDGDVKVDGELQRRVLPEKELLLSEKLDNSFKIESDYKGQEFTIECVNFIENAHETLVEDASGDRYYKIVEAGEGGRHDHYLKEGTIENIHNVLFTFNKHTKGAINISDIEGEQATLTSPFEGTVMRMADQKKSPVSQDSIQNLRLLSLYEIGEMKFVLPEKPIKGNYKIVKADNPKEANEDALTLKISSKGESKEIILQGGQGTANQMKTVKVGGLDFNMSYGSKEIELPFSLKLNDIVAERYPGTDPSTYGIGFKSYESKVTVEDDKPFDARIYMNNVLDYKGYRFFQSQIQFSTMTRKQNSDPDITILSVNHDFWGTWISYVGYFLLFLGMILILFKRNTRFGDLRRKLEVIKIKKAGLGAILLLMSLNGFSQDKHVKLSKEKVDSIIQARAIPADEAAKFGSLLIQDLGGRVKPVNTYAIELLRKVSKKDTYAGLDANQVLLSMIQNYKLWFDAPLIKLKRGNDSIRKVLEIPLKAKYAALSDFYTHKGVPKINPEWVKEANETGASKLNIFQKDIKRAYEDQRLLGQALSGSLIRVYPIPGDANNKWVSPLEISAIDYGPDSKVIKNLFPQGYFEFIVKKDYKTAADILDGIRKLQKGYSPDVIPSDDKIAAELFYNEYDVFKNLFVWYIFTGILMFVLLIFQIFYYKNKFLIKAIAVFKYTIIVLFLVHLIGLIMRWYISGHAPWSDAYESMIFIGFATMFFGLFFGRKSNITIAATAFVTSMIMMIAHWNAVDPAIANLQPVLDSYWVLIHVSIIVGSYGPFTLAFVLGLVSLLLMILTTEKNRERMDLNIQELTIITEQAVTIGLVMLTIGNFLGGMWANESWGRYWGWDPKETWALISIMIYAFVLHMRLVPGLRGRWTFNFMAVICFTSILMTYFGVNFYLAGLHSYASGDVSVTPIYIYYNLIAVVVIATWSYIKYKKYYKK
ncbi:MAG: cytochrome C biogenesis protein [Kordia sp.]|nr:MAG: cytochrome C biogenesis protein [Kordia sp.]